MRVHGEEHVRPGQCYSRVRGNGQLVGVTARTDDLKRDAPLVVVCSMGRFIRIGPSRSSTRGCPVVTVMVWPSVAVVGADVMWVGGRGAVRVEQIGGE